MSDGTRLLLEITTIEAAHLSALTTQFLELVENTGAAAPRDPAVHRLVPDAYPDDPPASEEFRRLTGDDLLGRRAADARTMLSTLSATGDLPAPEDLDEARALTPRLVTLDGEQTAAWLRALAAMRLVLASRLGIDDEDDRRDDDSRYLLYDWLGQRLEGLLQAVDG
ncbi:DUF2017 family protein [Microbacterium sp. RD1]|uniref:DUF2017 family protein n=1 Tax=Microbacterium sp. RD1 TaxID=3457313 RepID=UPI003FA5EE9B